MRHRVPMQFRTMALLGAGVLTAVGGLAFVIHDLRLDNAGRSAPLGRVPERMQKDPLITQVIQKLHATLDLVRTKDRTPPSPAAVNEVSSTMDSLVNEITKGHKDS